MADTSRIFPPGSHESNSTFRLTVPMVAHALRLQRTGALILFGLAGILLFYTTLDLAHTVTASKKAAFFVCLAIACVWPGAAAFHELRGGYYDALALCLLLLALATRSSLVTAICVFLAAWTDERALIASSLLFVFYTIDNTAGIRRLLEGKPVAVLAAAAGYLGTRAYLTVTHSYSVGGAGIGFSVLSHQTNIIPLGMWTGLGGSWIIVLLGWLTLFWQKRYAMAAGFFGALIAVVGGAFTVDDVTRSMAYSLPAVFVGLKVLSRNEPNQRIERLTMMSGVISLIVPTYYVEGSTGLWWLYPLPIQIARWLLPVLMRHRF